MYDAIRVRVTDLAAALPGLEPRILSGHFGPTLEAAAAHHFAAWRRRFEDHLLDLGGAAPQGCSYGSAISATLSDIADATRRAGASGERDPLNDFEVGFSAWFDPTDAGYFLINPFSEQHGMRADLVAGLGGQDWSYWDNTDPDENVPDGEWAARKASWDALAWDANALVWRWDAPPAICLAVMYGQVTVDRVAQILLDEHGVRLGYSGLEDAVAALKGPRSAPITAERAAVLRGRAGQFGEALEVLGGPGNLLRLAEVARRIERDEPWRALAEED